MKIYNDRKLLVILILDDLKKVQVFDIGYIPLRQNRKTKLKFEIVDLYNGTKYEDTAITELEFNGIGDH